MTDIATQHQLDTDQAAREASGAHAYGRYLEEFEVGAIYKHWPAKTVTESDDHLFCLITMNHHPLHLNDVYAAGSQQGREVPGPRRGASSAVVVAAPERPQVFAEPEPELGRRPGVVGDQGRAFRAP